jgi:hypothetical protein
MNTIELNSPVGLVNQEVVEKSESFYKRFNRFVESQSKNRAGWFMGSLLWQGVLCLPVPAFLIFYYHAPIWILIVTVLLFFANLVAGMCGSKINVLMNLLIGGTLLHIALVLSFVL